MIDAIRQVALRDVLERLRRARTFETVADDRLAGDHSIIRGTVELLRDEHDELTLREVGRHEPARPGVGATHNTLRWRAEGDVLTLEHLRQAGPTVAPTLLASFAPVDGALCSAPHLCANDVYSPTLELVGDASVQVAWCVRGPRKHAFIRTVYHPHP